MEEKPNYYSILPANVRYDNELRPNEKILYSEITALTSKNGECWASNEYFAKLYNVQPNAVATWIKHLKEKEYIDIEYKYINNTKEIEKRIIKIGGIQKDTTWYSKRYRGGIQKGEENNININNNNIYNIYEFYENVFSRTLNPIEYETMTKWLETKTQEEIIQAIKETAKSNIDNIKYVEKVLFSKKKNKIPDWFNKEITEDLTNNDLTNLDDDFQEFLKEIRNENI